MQPLQPLPDDSQEQTQEPAAVERPLGVTLITLFFLLEAMILLGDDIFSALRSNADFNSLAIGVALGLTRSLGFVVVAVGLSQLKKWAYWGAIVLCGLIVLSIPGWDVLLLITVAPLQLLAASYLLFDGRVKALFR